MKKTGYLSITIILGLLLLSPLALTAANGDKVYPYNWKSDKLDIVFHDEGAPRGEVVSSKDERVTYEYINIGQELDEDHGVLYGPYNPYAIKVKINSVSPSGYKLTVTIKVDGATQWSGALGAGQSSPTITCDGDDAEVRIVNHNDVTVSFTGTITLINN